MGSHTGNAVKAIAASLILICAAITNAHAQNLVTFHTSPPTPDADDQYNFIGASRDGLNANDSNGLDGPIDDDFTYVGLDRQPQGQTFLTPPATQVWRIQSIWIQMVGYTDNGTSPEPGYNGTDADLSVGGVFRVRLGTAGPLGAYNFGKSFTLTGSETNNPAPTGKITTANGSGRWMRFDVDTGDGPGGLAPNKLHFFEVSSVGQGNRQFEWLGTKSDVYPNGNAVNGPLATQTDLIGDRVFFVQMTLVPEPGTAAISALGALALPVLRRRYRCAAGR